MFSISHLRQSRTALTRAASSSVSKKQYIARATTVAEDRNRHIRPDVIRCQRERDDDEKRKRHSGYKHNFQQHRGFSCLSFLPSSSSSAALSMNDDRTDCQQQSVSSINTASSHHSHNYIQRHQHLNIALIETLEELCSILLTKVPKGFENFLPKNARTGNTNNNSDGGSGDGNNDDDKDKTAKEASNSSNDESSSTTSSDSKKTSGPSNNNNSHKNNKNKKEEERKRKKKEEEEMQQQLVGTTILLILVLMARSFFEDDAATGSGGVVLGGDGPEVTWHDFYNYMLTEGDVERIVVVNKKVARVYLRPGARGVPMAASGLGGGMRGGVMTKQISRPAQGVGGGVISSKDGAHPHDDEWDDGTLMEMNGGSDDSRSHAVSNPSSIPSSLGGALGGGVRKYQLVYHFNIGSVESFEDKLTHSQQELGISPRDYVPVQYASETNWAIELIKSAPALFLIGMTAYMLRGMGGMPGGGGGGRGGMGGIFQMGKSNAKLIKKEDVSVTFKDVAGCQEAKKEIMEFVDFLQDATQFTKLGAKIPKGALLTGPPGTGEFCLCLAFGSWTIEVSILIEV